MMRCNACKLMSEEVEGTPSLCRECERKKAEARVKWLERHIQKAINEIDQAQGNFNGVLPEDTADAIRDILVDGKDRQGEV